MTTKISPGNLIVRADANVAMGTGHIMRCLALAQAWQDIGGHVEAVMAEATPSVLERLKAEDISATVVKLEPASPEDAACTVDLAKSRQARCVVVDGYRFGSNYQRLIKEAGLTLLVMDDNADAAPYFADFIVNQNLAATEEMYSQREPCTKLLLGTRYAMLRREFAAWRRWPREISPAARKLLITMGGSDPDNVTGRAIEAVLRISQDIDINIEETVVLVGGSNPNFDALRALAAKSTSIRVLRDVSNIPEWMAWADVALSAAGTTCWEMCLMGLPSLLIVLAENQLPIAQALASAGAALYGGTSAEASAASIAVQLEETLSLSATKREAISRRARELVDGKGAARIVLAIRSADFRLRRAETDDCQTLWNWANDPAVRGASFHSQPIAWEDHVQWFHSRLAAPDAIIYVILEWETPVGVVRFQLAGGRAVISICVSPEFRGHGLGDVLLKMGMEKLFSEFPVNSVDAYIRVENVASIHLFSRAGFTRMADEQINGQPAVHYSFAKNQIL